MDTSFLFLVGRIADDTSTRLSGASDRSRDQPLHAKHGSPGLECVGGAVDTGQASMSTLNVFGDPEKLHLTGGSASQLAKGSAHPFRGSPDRRHGVLGADPKIAPTAAAGTYAAS
jgi:hypothetical protein